MKKFLLIIGLTAFTFGAFAEKVPSVIVNKAQGGWTAFFNLYNYVNYTPADASATGVGQLDCHGSGFTACRVPNCTGLNVYDGGVLSNVTEGAKLQAFTTAINDVIGQFEAAQEQHASAIASGGNIKAPMPTVFTKTIAIGGNYSGPAIKKNKTCVVRGVVTKNTSAGSTLKIYIESVNLTASVSGN